MSAHPHRAEPFEEVSEAHYAQTYLSGDFVHNLMADSVHLLTGRCPRCGFTFTTEATLTVVRSAVTTAPLATASTPPRTELSITVFCPCPGEHSGRPDDIPDGCGAYWAVLMEERLP
ncbi:hypothetical protein OG496_00990 [Streptomyces sp. NBC_00988]|uniref:hypothetical protein n=1 Tax=Streptomyces sp. NBC_00988 TaxID=2903704 RepID=UPI0038662DF5|nr:hypothetical protein OG496_00990 [Streptomyces sp. NBC_00988]